MKRYQRPDLGWLELFVREHTWRVMALVRPSSDGFIDPPFIGRHFDIEDQVYVRRDATHWEFVEGSVEGQ